MPLETLLQTNLPQLSVETRFNQGYRVASPVNGGGEIIAVCNHSGNVELFTTATDGAIWNFYPDPGSDTGYVGVATPLKGLNCAANVDANGKIVVFANIGIQLFYIVEDPTATSRWSKPVIVAIPAPKNPMFIAKILSTIVNGQLFVGVLTEFSSVISPTYAFAFSQWDTSAPSFQATSITFNSINCAWVGNQLSTLAFTCIDTSITAYNITTKQVSNYPMSSNFTSIDVASITDQSGNNQLFAILNDGNLYHLVASSNNHQFTWQQLAEGYNFSQVRVALDEQGNINIFSVGGNSQLYHLLSTTSNSTGFSSPPAPVQASVAIIGLATNNQRDIDVFSIEQGTNKLHHIYLEEVSGNWSVQQVEVPAGGKIEEYIAYSSDIVASDTSGLVLSNSPVKIWAAEPTWITVNGAVYYIDAHRPARMSTNGNGVLSICQEANGLAVPSLELSYINVMNPLQYIVIDQYGNIQEKLATTTGTDLMNATDQAGAYIIPDQYRTTSTTDTMATAINNCMNLGNSRSPYLNLYPSILHKTQRGVWLRSSGSIHDVSKLSSPKTAQHWQISFTKEGLGYKQFNEDEILSLLANKRAGVQSASGFFDWLDDLGDIVQGVVNGIVDIVDVVVTTVNNAVTAVITFIVDGVEYLFDAVVTLIDQVFDIVTTIFSKVKVFFEKLWEWIGFLFEWKDILRTHEALAYTLNQLLGFVNGSVANMQAIVDTGINNFQQSIASVFQDAIANIAGSSSLGGYDNQNKQSSPQFTSATSNNIVFNNIINNAGSVGTSSVIINASTNDSLQQLYDQLTAFADFTESKDAFTAAQTYFDNLGDDPAQVFSQLMAGLLSVAEGVIQAIISGVQVVVDAVFQVTQLLIAVLQETMNETWNIPIISDLYSMITDGAPFSALDVMSLLMAIPITAMYKIVYNSSPFPDETSVTNFKNGFTSQQMLQAAGFTSSQKGRALRADSGGLMPSFGTFFAVAGSVSTFFYGCFTAVNDAFPKDAPKPLSKIIWGLEAFSQAASFPWWTSSGAPSCDTSNSDGCSKTLWLFVNLGIAMDAVFIKLDGHLPENANDAGVIIQFLYASLGHLTFAIAASEAASGIQVANNILPVIPELCKLLRLDAVVKATKNISLGVLAAVDVLFYTSSAVVSFVASQQSNSQQANSQPAKAALVLA